MPNSAPDCRCAADAELPQLITKKADDSEEECEWDRNIAKEPGGRNRAVNVHQQIQLRGVRLGTLLQNSIGLFKGESPEAADDDDPYKLSKECKEDPGLDYFLSHAWTMSSIPKTLFLLVHFNRKAMIVLSTILALLVGIVKLVMFIMKYDGWMMSMMPGSINAGIVGYFLGLFFGHWILPTRKKTIFVDKACIRQCRARHDMEYDKELLEKDNPEETHIMPAMRQRTLSSGSKIMSDPTDCPACLEMKAGIDRIGDYLEHSSTLLVVLHCDYFTRLWCVYEFACFLRRHKPKDIHIISPQGVALCLIGPVLIITLKVLKGSLLESPHEYIVSFLTGLVWLLIDMIAVCELSDYTSKTLSENIGVPLRSFKIAETHCAFESDRDLIYDNIGQDYGRISLFESFIQQRVSQSLIDAHLRVPCLTCIAMAIPIFWASTERTVQWVTTMSEISHPGALIAAEMVMVIIYISVTYPIAVSIMIRVRRCLKSKILLALTLTLGACVAQVFVRKCGESGPQWFTLVMAVTLLHAFTVAWLHRNLWPAGMPSPIDKCAPTVH
ncbi:hypothetical protein FOL47_004027 [Perkinsus chesapeaki]|uniref:Uncharacterized protein n=1 Tax=Perkinsus chesapeaki TaxID=330153 RepID=A0A7J6M4V8_PERCH|nr:hypothetical protein FOL47_004027 [Perkinsus chesapeaki]